jgi:hypothetical protein
MLPSFTWLAWKGGEWRVKAGKIGGWIGPMQTAWNMLVPPLRRGLGCCLTYP